MLVWHLNFTKHMIMAIDERALDTLKAGIEQHRINGLTYRVYGRMSEGKPVPLKYLMGPEFELPRPYYDDQLDSVHFDR
jgi:hypothetical protein